MSAAAQEDAVNYEKEIVSPRTSEEFLSWRDLFHVYRVEFFSIPAAATAADLIIYKNGSFFVRPIGFLRTNAPRCNLGCKLDVETPKK